MKKEYFTFQDLKEFIENRLGKTEWVTVFSIHPDNDNEQGGYHPAILSKDIVDKALEEYSWEIGRTGGGPNLSKYHKNGKDTIKYEQYSEPGIEPLVYWREFYGIKKDYFDISQEFILFFNLYEDRKNRVFIKIDDNGEDEPVIRVYDTKVDFKLKYLKKFISTKNMLLVIYFDFMRFTDKTLDDLGLEEKDEIIKKKDLIYSFLIKSLESLPETTTQSWIMGKKVVYGIKDYKLSIFNDRSEDEYIEFIIGIDENGSEKYYTCYKGKLANSFGKNPNAPHYLAPVFFKKEVLKKYYDQPNKYSVNDGNISCKGLWSLRIDNNHPDCIMVFLGDLGFLQYKEQLYWKSFNITYDKGISRVAWKRGFKAEFTEPEEIVLYFKNRLDQFQKKWFDIFGWYLFKPLALTDEHHYNSLHIPFSNEQKEFDEQVLSLTKIIIDSLNEKHLSADVKIEKLNPRGIDKFESFLLSKQVKLPDMIEFIRKVQTLRSTSIAHRKSLKNKDYMKVKMYFDFDNLELVKIFENILTKTICIFNTLEKNIIESK